MASFRDFRGRAYAGRSARGGGKEGGDFRLWPRPRVGDRRGASRGRGPLLGGALGWRAGSPGGGPAPGRLRARGRRGSRRGARLARPRRWFGRGPRGWRRSPPALRRPSCPRARPPRREGRRPAGNGCVAARHLLRSVRAARSGCRCGPRGGRCGRFLGASPAGGVLVTAPGGRRAPWGAFGRPAAAWQPPSVRGRGGCVDARPPWASGSAGCPERGSRDQILVCPELQHEEFQLYPIKFLLKGLSPRELRALCLHG